MRRGCNGPDAAEVPTAATHLDQPPACFAASYTQLPGLTYPTTRPRPPNYPQIATVLALEKQGPAALQSLEAATASGMAGGSLITIPTAYKR